MVSVSINQAVPFLLLPVLTFYLRPGDFGYFNNFSAILIIFNAILGGGLCANIEKNYFVKDELYMNKLLGNLYFLLFCSAIVFFFVSMFLTSIFNITFVPKNVFLSIPFISFFFMSFEFFKTLLKIKKQALFFSIVTLSEVLLNISISLLLIIGFSFHWRGRVYGMVFSYVIFGLLSLTYFFYKKNIKFSINKKSIGKILKLSLPLLPSAISVMVMRRSGILFIDAFQGKIESGLYGVGLNFSTIILFISTPFLFTWTPHIYEKLSKRNQKNSIVSLRNKLFIFSLFIFSVCVLVSFLSSFALRVMTNEAFYRAGIFIPWLVFGFAFWAIRTMHIPFFIHHNRQKYITVIDSAGAGLNIILNYFTAKNPGAIGVAVAFSVSNFITFLWVFFSVRTFTGLPLVPYFKGIYAMIKNLVK